MDILIVAALIFGICFGVDKLFQKLFRNQEKHHTGTAVRLNKRYATIGLLLSVLGVAAIFASEVVLAVGGGVLVLTGICLIIYYLSFGIYYDKQGFLYARFGRRSVTYSYKDIKAQMLYNSAGKLLIELHMQDKTAVTLPETMSGVFTFMDTAFEGWLEQTGKERRDCDFYDPDNSCWFPTLEV